MENKSRAIKGDASFVSNSLNDVKKDIKNIDNRLHKTQSKLGRLIGSTTEMHEDLESVRKKVETANGRFHDLSKDLGEARYELSNLAESVTKTFKLFTTDICRLEKKCNIMKYWAGALTVVTIIMAGYLVCQNLEPIEPESFTATIDGKETALYVDEHNRIYQDKDLTVEFPNDDEEPWVYTGDPEIPFIMPYDGE